LKGKRSKEVQKRRSAKVQNSKRSALLKQLSVYGCFIFLFLIFFATCVYADDSSVSIFKKGNQLYEKGNYDEAIKEYSRLPEQGFESGSIYFNLGNSYFKKGEPGKAILNYERAKRLIPGDNDLKSNYNYAFSKIENTASQTSIPATERISGIYSNLTLNGLTILVSVVYILIISILTASIFIQSVKRYTVITICSLSLIFLSTAFSLYSRVSVLDKEAIILSKNAEVKFEPIDNATTHFTLYEGMKIYILETKDNWIKIRRSDGKSGWIKKDSIEII
jgi:tetratricopeptide (TPR) repeat protein